MWPMSNIYWAIQSHFSGVGVCWTERGDVEWWGTDSDVDKCQKQTSQTFKMSHEMNFIRPDGIELRSIESWKMMKIYYDEGKHSRKKPQKHRP